MRTYVSLAVSKADAIVIAPYGYNVIISFDCGRQLDLGGAQAIPATVTSDGTEPIKVPPLLTFSAMMNILPKIQAMPLTVSVPKA